MTKRKRINWLKHGIEFFGIIISVILGFMVTDWYDQHKEKQLEKQFLSSFCTDITSDISSLDTVLILNKAKLKRVIRMMEYFKKEKIHPDSALSIVGDMMSYFNFDASQSTYESIKSSGSLGLINNYKLKNGLVAYYQSVEWKKYQDEIWNTYLNNYIIPFTINNLDFVHYRFVHSSAFRTNYFKNLVIGYYSLLNQQVRYYENVHQNGTKLKLELESELLKK